MAALGVRLLTSSSLRLCFHQNTNLLHHFLILMSGRCRNSRVKKASNKGLSTGVSLRSSASVILSDGLTDAVPGNQGTVVNIATGAVRARNSSEMPHRMFIRVKTSLLRVQRVANSNSLWLERLLKMGCEFHDLLSDNIYFGGCVTHTVKY